MALNVFSRIPFVVDSTSCFDKNVESLFVEKLPLWIEEEISEPIFNGDGHDRRLTVILAGPMDLVQGYSGCFRWSLRGHFTTERELTPKNLRVAIVTASPPGTTVSLDTDRLA